MKTKFFFRVLMLIVLSVMVHPLKAQENSAILTIEDIYKNNVYRQDGYGPVHWMKDNKGYSTLELNQKTGGRDIVRYDAKTGKRSVLVSSSQLIPEGKSKPLSIRNYLW